MPAATQILVIYGILLALAGLLLLYSSKAPLHWLCATGIVLMATVCVVLGAQLVPPKLPLRIIWHMQLSDENWYTCLNDSRALRGTGLQERRASRCR